MPRLLTPTDVYEFANAWQDEAIGKNATTQAVDMSSLMSVGEAIMASGMENTINSLYMLMGKLWVSARKYKGKAKIVQARNTGVYTHRFAKIYNYSQGAIASGYWNTDIKTNFAPGYTNGENGGASTKSMWEQNPAVTITFTFGGSNVLDFEAPTMYLDKLEAAFRSESEFREVINGIMVTFDSDMEQYRENFNRACLVGAMAQDVAMEDDRPESVVHMITEFNTEFGTNYTEAELKTTYSREFYTWLASKIEIVMDRMHERSLLFHYDPVKTVGGVDRHILSFTPNDKMKIAAYGPDFIKLEKLVLPETFQLNKLKINTDRFEKFNYWQNIENPDEINVKPAVIDTDSTSATYLQQIDGTQQEFKPFIYIFDEDRVLTDEQFKRALSSPVEARKGFYNIWHHWEFSFICTPQDNSCIFLWD